MSSFSSSSSSGSDESMNQQEQALVDPISDDGVVENAYWVQRTIREAIYGRVLFAVVLKKRPRALSSVDGAEWEATSDHCAVKEMSWQHIRRERDRLAEDPIKEVASMQYLKNWFEESRRNKSTPAAVLVSETGLAESFIAMRETNIMMPLDLLTDERNLYSIMPYCDGGELFERLDLNERFSEGEARYWMDQVLNVSGIESMCRECLAILGPALEVALQLTHVFRCYSKGLENLQHVGICHRDMSLENLLVHKDGALIIDMGMCLMTPYQEPTANIADSFKNMSMNGVTPMLQQSGASVSGRLKPRFLIKPQGTCGKWIYMSPEVYQNSEPFDGFAVDMWAAGVILFLMLTGFPPWERACATDDRFKYMTAGYLVQMLTEWELGLSGDAMDLLQRMLFLDPKDRLSLDQVRAHPWMVNGKREAPLGLVAG
jgi:serine/threonine protein kinase